MQCSARLIHVTVLWAQLLLCDNSEKSLCQFSMSVMCQVSVHCCQEKQWFIWHNLYIPLCACWGFGVTFNSNLPWHLWLAYKERKGGLLNLKQVFCQEKEIVNFVPKKVAGKISIWCHRVLKRVCPEFWKFICEESLIKKITTYVIITDSYKISLQCYLWWHLSLRIILFKLHYLQTW